VKWGLVLIMPERLKNAFQNFVKAIEARNGAAAEELAGRNRTTVYEER
jgi:hypothetical protein